MQRPFGGVRIIDATHALAGPPAAHQRALRGADAGAILAGLGHDDSAPTAGAI